MERRHWNHGFASAHDFPKFVKVGAEVEHELRKVGTGLGHDPLCKARKYISRRETTGNIMPMRIDSKRAGCLSMNYNSENPEQGAASAFVWREEAFGESA